MTVAGLGAGRLTQVGPPHLAALDHRRLRVALATIDRLRLRRARADGSSPGCPACAIAVFQAAVASAGAPSRERKSRAATTKKRLRDTLSRRAHASTS